MTSSAPLEISAVGTLKLTREKFRELGLHEKLHFANRKVRSSGGTNSACFAELVDSQNLLTVDHIRVGCFEFGDCTCTVGYLDGSCLMLIVLMLVRKSRADTDALQSELGV